MNSASYDFNHSYQDHAMQRNLSPLLPSRISARFFSGSMLLCTTLTLAACGGSDGSQSAQRGTEDHSPEHIESAGRLAILDSQTNAVNIIDIDSGQNLGTFPFEGTAPSLYTSPENRYVLVVQRDANRVSFIDGGLYTEDHGDHIHDYAETPALTGFSLSGVRPTHYTYSKEIGIIFNDGNSGSGLVSSVDVFSEEDITNTGAVTSITLENAMHGVAKQVNDQLFVTYRDPSITDTTLPAAVDRYSLDGDTATFIERYDTPCPRLHGAGANESYLAFGCDDGVMLIETDNADYPARKLANPEGLTESERIGTIETHHDVSAFVGVASNKLFVIQPEQESPYQPLVVPGTSNRIDQGFSHDGTVFFVLTADGNVHLYDTQNGWSLTHTLAVAPAQAEGQAAPAIVPSMSDNHLYVVSPASTNAVMVDADNGTTVKNIPLSFTPGRIAWVGFNESDDHDH